MSETLPGESDSLSDRLRDAERRNRSMATVPDAFLGDDLLKNLRALKIDTTLDARMRAATLNLMQDAIEARRREEREASARAVVQAAFLERDAQLRLALDVAAIGTFSWELSTLRCEADARLRSLCGRTDHEAEFLSLPALVPAVDYVGLEKAVKEALRPDGPGQLRGDFAVRAPDGTERWLAITAVVEFSGEPRRGTRMRGAVLDVTERKLADAALRASEERFRQFAAASSDVLWIRDAATLQLEFVSASFERVYGAPPASVQAPGDLGRWASLIVPDDRMHALDMLAQARRGEPVVHECRIMRQSDGEFRWIRNTDFPLRDLNGNVQRIAGIASDITDTKQLIQHQGILVAELQHRVRNIMAMIRALASRTGQHATDVGEYSEVLTGRLMSMARTQALLTRNAQLGVEVRQIVVAELSAQGQSDQYTVRGPSVVLAAKAAEVLTLVVHELTTNAMKYGAFSSAGGIVSVRWNPFERAGQAWMSFSWSEQRGGEPLPDIGPPSKGFGSELIEQRVPYELRGNGNLQISPEGVECLLEFPLIAGASVLETSAPQQRHVSGGSIDMHGEIDLRNARVLLVEDDFYLAGDAERALRSAGAIVQGPFPSEEPAQQAIEDVMPDCAVLDINLGHGPSYRLAQLLREAQVPFVFITGYDGDVIPEQFRDVRLLHKPVEFRTVVRSVAEMVHGDV